MSVVPEIAIAVQLRRYSTAKNPWISQMLGMGDPDVVSRYVGEYERGDRKAVEQWIQKITDIRT